MTTQGPDTKSRFFVLYGEDTFSRQEEYLRIRHGLGPDDSLAGNISEFDGAGLRFAELRNVCIVIPFLAEKRLAVVRGLLDRFEPPRTRAGQPHPPRPDPGEWKDLAAFAPQMPPSTVLVLLDVEATRESNGLLKSLEPVATIRDFPRRRKKEEVEGWIRGRVGASGTSIAQDAVRLLADLVGNDLWALSSEIEKLLAYGQGRPISRDDVKLLVSHCREESIFGLVDAILEGQAGQAQRSLSRLLDAGDSPLTVLAMTTRQLRLTVCAKAAGPESDRAELGHKLGLQGFPLDKTLRQARASTWPRLRMAYRRLVETDLAIKTGKCEGDLALTLLVADLRLEQGDKQPRLR